MAIIGTHDETKVIARQLKKVAIRNCENIPKIMHVLPVADSMPRILGTDISATYVSTGASSIPPIE
jgi:hypothetical protein